MSISDYAYHPASITVALGAKVAFTNHDQTAHTTTSQRRGFDTGTINPRHSAALTLNTPGTYTYYCQFHPFMHGTIIIERRPSTTRYLAPRDPPDRQATALRAGTARSNERGRQRDAAGGRSVEPGREDATSRCGREASAQAVCAGLRKPARPGRHSRDERFAAAFRRMLRRSSTRSRIAQVHL